MTLLLCHVQSGSKSLKYSIQIINNSHKVTGESYLTTHIQCGNRSSKCANHSASTKIKPQREQPSYMQVTLFSPYWGRHREAQQAAYCGSNGPRQGLNLKRLNYFIIKDEPTFRFTEAVIYGLPLQHVATEQTHTHTASLHPDKQEPSLNFWSVQTTSVSPQILLTRTHQATPPHFYQDSDTAALIAHTQPSRGRKILWPYLQRAVISAHLSALRFAWWQQICDKTFEAANEAKTTAT